MASKQPEKSKKTSTKKPVVLAGKKAIAKPVKKRYNSKMITDDTTYMHPTGPAKFPHSGAGYGEPVRHATTLQFPGNYSCEVWTGSSGQDWRNCPVFIDWVFGPSGVVQFQLPHKGTGIASIDAMHKPSPLVVPLNMPDFQAPKIPHKWWWNLTDDILLHKPRRILLMCLAGRGRTGTMLSILYGIVQPHEFTNASDLVRHIRTLGCDKWVEAHEQLSYIADVLNMDVGDDDGLFHKTTGVFTGAPQAHHSPLLAKDNYLSSKIENAALDVMKNPDVLNKAIELTNRHVNAQHLYAALYDHTGSTIDGQWFDQHSGTSKLPEMQASMVYILFRDHFNKIKKEFLGNLRREDAVDFVKICKSKMWA